MNYLKSSGYYLLLIAGLATISTSVAYYKYIVRQDITYYATEEEIPSQFELTTYLRP